MPRDLTTDIPDDLVRPLPADSYGYDLALHMAGLDVLESKQFGSYQGDWIAIVRAPDGSIGVIKDSFGSCTVCDAFEAEFSDWNASEKPDYADRLRDFGRKYLIEVMTFDEAIAACSANAEWDMEATDMVAWLRAHSTPGAQP